jgi:cell division septation protein DedD
MALKVGTENKRNVIIASGLFVVVAVLVLRMLFTGDSTPAPAPAPAARAPQSAKAPNQTSAATSNSASGQAAHKLPGLNLDPALHLEKLLSSETIEYAGNGRNIFSADSMPVVIDEPAAPARNQPDPTTIADNTPAAPPTPPAIELKYFGYAATKDGKRQAFLIHGEDIFEAGVGEIVNHRYKVVAVLPASVQVTDLSYNNTQTLAINGN